MVVGIESTECLLLCQGANRIQHANFMVPRRGFSAKQRTQNTCSQPLSSCKQCFRVAPRCAAIRRQTVHQFGVEHPCVNLTYCVRTVLALALSKPQGKKFYTAGNIFDFCWNDIYATFSECILYSTQNNKKKIHPTT